MSIGQRRCEKPLKLSSALPCHVRVIHLLALSLSVAFTLSLSPSLTLLFISSYYLFFPNRPSRFFTPTSTQTHFHSTQPLSLPLILLTTGFLPKLLPLVFNFLYTSFSNSHSRAYILIKRESRGLSYIQDQKNTYIPTFSSLHSHLFLFPM